MCIIRHPLVNLRALPWLVHHMVFWSFKSLLRRPWFYYDSLRRAILYFSTIEEKDEEAIAHPDQSEADLERQPIEEVFRRERRASKWNVLARRVSIGRLRPSDGESSLSSADSTSTAIGDDRAGLARQDLDYLVRTLRSPTLGTYTSLTKTLETCSREWMSLFLGHNGLGILLKALAKLCEKNSPSVVDTFLQIGCVACVKSVMNSQTGLDCIIENQDFTRKFSSGKLINDICL